MPSKNPLVSIVCVTYNAEKNLPGLISSVALKKSDDIEFIVIDGSSTDGTIDILKQSGHVIDFWLSEPDNGIYDAMNKAIGYAKGQWIIFFGADDLLGNGFSEALPLLKDDGSIYYGNAIFYGKVFEKIYDDYYLTKLNICHQTIFYPKKVFSKYKFNVNYVVYADYLLNLQCWHDPELNFVHIDHLVAIYSDGGFSSTTKDMLFETDRDRLFKKYLKPASYYRYLNRTRGLLGAVKQFVGLS